MCKAKNVKESAQEFEYKVDVVPSSYLGLPLGAPFKSISIWDSVEEKLHKR